MTLLDRLRHGRTVGKRLRCVSLHEPYATLMALGKKKNETRSWATSHTGPLAIHAAKHWNREQAEICEDGPFASVLVAAGINVSSLPLGCIVAVVNLVRCVPTESFGATLFCPGDLTEDEWYFGDYGRGRKAWLTEDPFRLPDPIRYKGAQGLFFLPNDIIDQILNQMEKNP